MDEPIRRFAEQNLAWLRRLLETGCHVHRIPRYESVASRGVAGDHLPGVQARAPFDRDAALAPQRLVEDEEPLPDFKTCAYGPKCVVLVHPRDAEDGHHRVTDELLDYPTV